MGTKRHLLEIPGVWAFMVGSMPLTTVRELVYQLDVHGYDPGICDLLFCLGPVDFQRTDLSSDAHGLAHPVPLSLQVISLATSLPT